MCSNPFEFSDVYCKPHLSQKALESMAHPETWTHMKKWSVSNCTRALWRRVLPAQTHITWLENLWMEPRERMLSGTSRDEKDHAERLEGWSVGWTNQTGCLMRRSKQTGKANTFTPGWLVWTSPRLPARSRSWPWLLYSSCRERKETTFWPLFPLSLNVPLSQRRGEVILVYFRNGDRENKLLYECWVWHFLI